MEETNIETSELTEEELAAKKLVNAEIAKTNNLATLQIIYNGVKLATTKLDKDITGGKLTLAFFKKALDGEKTDKSVPCLQSITLNLDALPDDVKKSAMYHGFSQKFGDNLALTKEDKETVTIKQAIERTQSLYDQLLKGDWNAKGKTKAESMTVDSVQAQFLAGIAAGITTYEQANTLYKMMAKGKELPKPE